MFSKKFRRRVDRLYTLVCLCYTIAFIWWGVTELWHWMGLLWALSRTSGTSGSSTIAGRTQTGRG